MLPKDIGTRRACEAVVKTAAMFLCVLLMPLRAGAQEPVASPTPAAGPAEDLAKLRIPAWTKGIIDSFSKPLHPLIGGVATNGGVGAGLGYTSPEDVGWFQDARAMMTLRRFWLLEGEVGRRYASKRAQIGAFGAIRHMGRLDYFGIGPDTDSGSRSAFRLRETAFGTRGWFRVIPAVRVGGGVSAYIPDLGPSNSSSIPPIEAVFTDGAVPGFSAQSTFTQPTFDRYRGFIEFLHPVLDNPNSLDDLSRYRGAYQVAFEAMRDHDAGRHNLHRWELETQQRFPGFRPNQRLTLHGFLASTNNSADVPFYLLYTLGGTGGLKTFRPDMLGGDGTLASLRGFRNFRFRDRDLVLMQAEYRIPVHRSVHTTVFVDAGQVAPRTSELFSDLRANTGFSVSVVRKGKTLGRLDVGFGGGEGVNLFWSFGGFQD
jgi:hypothetical protein